MIQKSVRAADWWRMTDSPLLLLVDETNNEPNDYVDFFVLGGLALECRALPGLHEEIVKIREAAGFVEGDQLKFHTRSRPDQVDVPVWNIAKQQVLEAAASHGARFFTCVVHHSIARDRKERIVNQFRELVRLYNAILTRQEQFGMVVADRLDGYVNEHELFGACFSEGLIWESGYSENLDRILLLSSTNAKASHLASVLDVALGTFGFCINQRSPNNDRPRQLMPLVRQLMSGFELEDGAVDPLGTSLILRPCRSTHYSREYEQLLEHIEGLDAGLRFTRHQAPYC